MMSPHPQEQTPLLPVKPGKDIEKQHQQHTNKHNEWITAGCDETQVYYPPHFLCTWNKKELKWAVLLTLVTAGMLVVRSTTPPSKRQVFQAATGPYKLVERQSGEGFLDHYKFYDGPDSLGSGGHQVYVGRERAAELGIYNMTSDGAIMMKSAPSTENKTLGKRESIRLEGKRRYDRGLFVLDLDHLPAGAGVWPAFWMTDEAHWPDHGEIDIVENINYQNQAKTALHTGGQCRMYGQIPDHSYTGEWDRATGIPDPSTNKSNTVTDIEADDCWNLAAHRWYNQGCVLVDKDESSIGGPFNDNGGGIFVLEWDPENGYIKSWSFPRNSVPRNLENAIATSSPLTTEDEVELPNPSEWGLPYAYFAIGANSECSADHFQNMRLVFNLAFCGEVAGQRFFKDCTEESKLFNVSNSPVKSCNAYIESDPKALDEAYWKIRGVYTWERELQLANLTQLLSNNDDDDENSQTGHFWKKKDVGPQ